jgi:hypothetical protein
VSFGVPLKVVLKGIFASAKWLVVSPFFVSLRDLRDFVVSIFEVGFLKD